MAMDDSRSQMAAAILNRTAPGIVQSLLDYREFKDEYRLRLGRNIVFKNHDFSVSREVLYECVRRVSSKGNGLTILDTEQREWLVERRLDEEMREVLTISREGKCIGLPKIFGLSADRVVRLREFDEVAEEVNLPTRDSWSRSMRTHPLDDDAIEDLHADLCDTPSYFGRSLREQIGAGRVDIGSLIPRSKRFYERLVGVYDGSATIREYGANVLHGLFEELINWRDAEGLMLCLLLSNDRTVTKWISEVEVSQEVLLDVLGRLERHGDWFSQVGGIEYGLRLVGDYRDIEPVIATMVAQIVEEGTEVERVRLGLVLMLFRVVDGELMRWGLFSEEAPFYRRLASWAHAALVTQQALFVTENVNSFCEWIGGLPNSHFFWGNYADMRRESRWSPDIWDEGQARGDCLIRLMEAGMESAEKVSDPRLVGLGSSQGAGSAWAACQADSSFVPYRASPVAGSDQMARVMVREIADAVEQGLERARSDVRYLAPLVRAAAIFRVEKRWAEEAAVVLDGYCGESFAGKDRSEVNGILRGLALVAAVGRSDVLAGRIWAGCRRRLVDAESPMSVEEAVRICVTAAASREDLGAWREFVGECLTELAFGDLRREECMELLSYMGWLMELVPGLWIDCGRAEAALRAYCGSGSIKSAG